MKYRKNKAHLKLCKSSDKTFWSLKLRVQRQVQGPSDVLEEMVLEPIREAVRRTRGLRATSAINPQESFSSRSAGRPFIRNAGTPARQLFINRAADRIKILYRLLRW